MRQDDREFRRPYRFGGSWRRHRFEHALRNIGCSAVTLKKSQRYHQLSSSVSLYLLENISGRH